MLSTVVVTALARLDGSDRRPRGVSEYLHLARHVLGTGVPVVAFVTPDVRDALEEVAQACGADIRIVAAPFEEWPGVDAADAPQIALARARGAFPRLSSDEAKDTVPYVQLQWAKPHLVQAAHELTGADRLWWLDIGIAHVSPLPAELGDALMSLPFETAIVVRDTGPQPPGASWAGSDGLGLACGGAFGVRGQAADWLADEARATCSGALAGGEVVFDEQVLTAVALAHPDRVRVVHGSHQRLLTSLVVALDPAGSVTGPPPVAAPPRPMQPEPDLPGAGDAAAILIERPGARQLSLVPDLVAPIGWSWLNPSIAVNPIGGFLVTVRCSNYVIEGWDYRTAEPDGVIRTRTALMGLDVDLVPLWSRWIDDSAARAPEPLFSVHGLEDMRLFRRDGRWWVIAACREHTARGEVRQVLAQLVDVPTRPRLTGARLLPSPVDRHPGVTVYAEKNWMPITDSSRRPAFVWSVDPLVIVESDPVTGRVTERGRRAIAGHEHRLRGGGAVFESPWGGLGVVHEVAAPGIEAAGPYRRYVHRFVRFDDRMQDAAIGPAWTIGRGALEYVAGGCVADGLLLLSFGHQDAQARVLALPVDAVRDLVEKGPFVRGMRL